MMDIIDGFLNTSEGLTVLIDLTLLALYLTRERMEITRYCPRCYTTRTYTLVRLTEAGRVFQAMCGHEVVILNEGAKRLQKEK